MNRLVNQWTLRLTGKKMTSLMNLQLGGKTLYIVVSSMFSPFDVDRMLNSILLIPWFRWSSSPAFHFSQKGLGTMKIFLFLRGKWYFYHSRTPSEYGYITESWLLGKLSLYSEWGLAGANIIPKVNILQHNIKLPNICLI